MKQTSSRRGSLSRHHRNITTPSLPDARCILYIRASTEDQKNTLEAQAYEAQNFAAANGKEIVATFIEPGVSGSKPFLQRKQAKAAIRQMKKDGVSTLLVLKLDRAFRNIVDMHTTIDTLLDSGISMRVVQPDMDFHGPFGRLIATLLGAIAEFELGLRSERQKSGFDSMRRKRVSRSQFAPFGWGIGPAIEGESSHAGRPLRRLIPIPGEQSVLRQMVRLYEENHTLQSIADQLNSDNIPTKRAGQTMRHKGRTITISGQWKPGIVKSVLEHAELATPEELPTDN